MSNNDCSTLEMYCLERARLIAAWPRPSRNRRVAHRTSLDDTISGLPAQSVQGAVDFCPSTIRRSVAPDFTEWRGHARLPGIATLARYSRIEVSLEPSNADFGLIGWRRHNFASQRNAPGLEPSSDTSANAAPQGEAKEWSAPRRRPGSPFCLAPASLRREGAAECWPLSAASNEGISGAPV